jgi:hypothetical protein
MKEAKQINVDGYPKVVTNVNYVINTTDEELVIDKEVVLSVQEVLKQQHIKRAKRARAISHRHNKL